MTSNRWTALALPVAFSGTAGRDLWGNCSASRSGWDRDALQPLVFRADSRLRAFRPSSDLL